MFVVSDDSVRTHHDVPVMSVPDWRQFDPSSRRGFSRYECSLPEGMSLQTLFLNKRADTVLVCLHGATNRAKKELPRFEWMRTARRLPYSSVYISDPCLTLDPRLELAWYTGTLSFDIRPVLVEWIARLAASSSASRVVIAGSSGGGFASLQLSSFLANSVAVPFSPQTAITSYYAGGSRAGAQRMFLRSVMPELTPERPLEEYSAGFDWSGHAKERLSAIERYSDPRENFVYYVQNENDVNHLRYHYLPFKANVEKLSSSRRFMFDVYGGEVGHNPPSREVFTASIESALRWHEDVS